MNFLAHLYLSADEPEAMVGNLVADFVKGPELDRLSAGVMAGVRQHRLVDAFTDRHPVVQRSIRRISEKWGWFSGMILDVYFDHILARDWEQYHSEPLREFVDRVHRVIQVHAHLIPDRERVVALRFVETDRLMSYAESDGSGVDQALKRLSVCVAERIPKRAKALDEAMPDLRSAHTELVEDFHQFFPEVIQLARTWK